MFEDNSLQILNDTFNTAKVQEVAKAQGKFDYSGRNLSNYKAALRGTKHASGEVEKRALFLDEEKGFRYEGEWVTNTQIR